MLTFCLNAFPCGSLDELREAVLVRAAAVRRRYNSAAGTPDAPFAVGMWLGHAVAARLAGDVGARAVWAEELSRAGFYAETFNAFPYGVFHGQTVKTRVYTPDWATPERLAYTEDCARVLAALLPDGAAGTISTLPLGYAPRRPGGGRDYPDARVADGIANLRKMAGFLCALENETGKTVRLALEPEPDCFLDDAASVSAFYPRLLAAAADENERRALRRFVGICLDTAHTAARFEDAAAVLAAWTAAEIPVYKAQFACALETDIDSGLAERLRPYNDRVYLHQSAWTRSAGESPRLAPDLPEALAALAGEKRPGGVLRAHYHLPFSVTPPAGIRLAGRDLPPDFLDRLRTAGCGHFESEVYTLGLLTAPETVPGIFADEMRFIRGLSARAAICKKS